MKSEELESGFTPSRILFKWGIWDEKEREWQRESEFIKSNIILMFKVNVFSEPCDLGHFPQETFHLNAKIQFLLNNELLNIGTILFQPYFPTACTKKHLINIYRFEYRHSLSHMVNENYLKDTPVLGCWQPTVLDSPLSPFPLNESRKYTESRFENLCNLGKLFTIFQTSGGNYDNQSQIGHWGRQLSWE